MTNSGLTWSNVFTSSGETTQQKTKSGVLYDAQKKKREKVRDKNEKRKNKGAKAGYESFKTQYESLWDPIIKDIGDTMFNHWRDETTEKLKILRLLKDENTDKSKLNDLFDEIAKKYDSYYKDISKYEECFKRNPGTITQVQLNGWTGNVTDETFPNWNSMIRKYVEKSYDYYCIVRKKKTNPVSVADEKEKFFALGKLKFLEMQQALFKLMEEYIRLLALFNKMSFDTFKITSKLAELPLMLDDKIREIRIMLEKLLGAFLGALPDSIDFDLDLAINQLLSMIEPTVAAVMPLTSIVGNIPVLGDLIGLLKMLQTFSSPADSTKDWSDICELFCSKGKLPKFPENWKELMVAVKDDIFAFIALIPMIVNNVLMEMINLIYSKLKIITSVIPLGNMFPLNLIPLLLTAFPLLWKMMKALPSIMYNMILNMGKKKWAEIMSLMSIPKPNLDFLDELAELKALENPTAPKKRKYSDVTNEMYDKLKYIGFTKTLLKTLQSEYVNSHNGSDLTIIYFQDNGKDQNLPSVGGKSLIDVATIGFTNKSALSNINDSANEYGYTKSSFVRSKATVDDYESWLKTIFANIDIMGDNGVYTNTDVNMVVYPKLMDASELMGEWYEGFKDIIHDDLGVTEMVLVDTLMRPLMKNKVPEIMAKQAAMVNKIDQATANIRNNTSV